MDKKKKKGFTLIELLAIIVILAIVAVITVPIILNIIENSKRGAARNSAFGYKDSINKFYVSKTSENSDYIMPDGVYTINPENGYLVGTGDIASNEPLTIQFSGNKPNGGSVELEKNVIKQACVRFDDYVISITNGVVGEAVKGSCNGTLIGSSSSEDTSNTTTAAQTLMATAITETELNEYSDKSNVKVPVIINHPAITENTATGSTIPALTSYTYMGSDPDNYIYFNCESYNEAAQNEQNCEVWRIISIENGQLKITSEDSITTGYWDHERVINDWATSDLNDFLNGKYLNNGVTINFEKNNKKIVIDNKNYLGSWYDYFEPATIGITGRNHGLINLMTKNLVANSTWYLGAVSVLGVGSWTPSSVYSMERGNNVYTGDGLTRTTYINSKIAIISPSDYLFASSNCYNQSLYDYSDDSGCVESNWIFNFPSMNDSSGTMLLLSPFINPGDAGLGVYNTAGMIYAAYDGQISMYYSDLTGFIRPTLYLNANISLTANDGYYSAGSINNPYKIIINS